MLASVIRAKLAPVIRECPQECGIVSITEVTVSPEYSVVTIYLSALSHPDEALAFLDGRKRELRALLSSLHLRRVPTIRFTMDQRAIRGDRIDQLLREEEQKHPGDTSQEAQD